VQLLANDLALDPIRHARLTSGAVVVRPTPAILGVAGAGAVQCLQGLLTADLVKAGPATIHWGALLTPKGMIETDLWALRNGDEVVLLIPTEGVEKARTAFTKSLPPRLAKVTDLSESWSSLLLFGARAEAALRESGIVRHLPEAGHLAVAEDGTLIARGSTTSPFVFFLAGPAPAIAACSDRLIAAGMTPGTAEDAEAARILAGWPLLGAEIDEKTLPQEARFDELGGVSYTKGCYLGQETVARLHFRGHPNRELRGLEWEDAGPLEGRTIEGAGRVAGTVRSTLVIGGRRFGLAPIRREVAIGDAVVAGGRPARVVALPFADLLIA
jgi:folate-binding protein YgfZ